MNIRRFCVEHRELPAGASCTHHVLKRRFTRATNSPHINIFPTTQCTYMHLHLLWRARAHAAQIVNYRPLAY